MPDPATGFRLALFFTRGMSLHRWENLGMFDREVALYQRLQERGVEVVFVTHGDNRDLTFAERLTGIRILCNRWGLPGRVYRPLLTWLHRRALREADVFKTNQTLGADLALRAARRWHRPLIARCGYMLSEFLAREHGEGSAEATRARALEAEVFGAADRVVVTTEEMRRDLGERLPAVCEKTEVIPNHVDTDLFRPADGPPSGVPRLCFVGRLVPQKNLGALIEAVRGLEVEVDLIGTGPLHESLEAQARDNPRVHFLGPIAHGQLPDHLRRSTLFVLPSLYEGHPKTLIEAMACGLPVLGTDVSGIRNVVRHGETGHLCQTDAASLCAEIETLLADSALRSRLGRSARDFAVAHFSLEKIAERELALLRDVTDKSLRT